MAIDLEKIRAKVAQLSGQGRRDLQPSKILNLDLGEHVLRAFALPNNDGEPFAQRMWYYNVGPKQLLAPYQFGKPDPVQDLINKCRASKNQEEKDLAKKLYPKMRGYIPVIVRGREKEGVLWWSVGKTVYNRVLNFFLDADVGDITDPTEGRDLKVKISQAPGKEFRDTAVDAAFKCSRAGTDKEIKEWLANIPDLSEIYKLKSTEEVKQIVENWLNGVNEVPGSGTGTVKVGNTDLDELDKLVSEVSAPAPESSSSVSKKTGKTGAEKKATVSLDDAFADLLDK